jgi:hypothetical protein
MVVHICGLFSSRMCACVIFWVEYVNVHAIIYVHVGLCQGVRAVICIPRIMCLMNLVLHMCST